MQTQQMSRLAAAAALAIAVAIPAAHAQIMAVPIPGAPPAELYTNAPQADPGDDPANWSPYRNVVESNRYEQLVRTNPAFRAARIRQECGPITDPYLFQQCLATFE
jgi:hypothetical protein